MCVRGCHRRASYGACGTGFDIKVGGHTSMTEVSSIKLGTMAPDSWGNKEIGEGTAGDFVKIQHLLLTTATAAVESAGSKHGGHRRHAGNKS
jgi:6-phosphogluconate dehydrogenase (decarboxylating)